MPGDFEKMLESPACSANTLAAPGDQWRPPAIAGASTFAKSILQEDVLATYREILTQLEGDSYNRFLLSYLGKGLDLFGRNWQYADTCTVLLALSHHLRVSDYLEIGVGSGRSMAMVGSQRTKCNMVGFDNWKESQGPYKVRQELAKFNYTGESHFVTGDTHETVPPFLESNPNRFFDLITVSSQDSDKDALLDLLNVLTRLKVGGALVFDNISHPEHPGLLEVWNKAVASRPNFSSFQFTELGYGVAFAIRHY